MQEYGFNAQMKGSTANLSRQKKDCDIKKKILTILSRIYRNDLTQQTVPSPTELGAIEQLIRGTAVACFLKSLKKDSKTPDSSLLQSSAGQ